MNIQELMTAVQFRLPVKVAILNNRFLGMVRQWQELFWEGRYSGTSFEPFQPGFARLAEAYGIPGTTVTEPHELEDALAEALAVDGPALVDVHVTRRKHVKPAKGGPGRVFVAHSDTLRVAPREPEGRLRKRGRHDWPRGVRERQDSAAARAEPVLCVRYGMLAVRALLRHGGVSPRS